MRPRRRGAPGAWAPSPASRPRRRARGRDARRDDRRARAPASTTRPLSHRREQRAGGHPWATMLYQTILIRRRFISIMADSHVSWIRPTVAVVPYLLTT